MKPFDRVLIGVIVGAVLLHYYPPKNPETPGPNPGKADGRVLLVNGKLDNAKLNIDQVIAIESGELRDWLKDKVATEPDGTLAIRMYYDGQDLSKEDKIWQDMMKRPRSDLPWVYADKGRKHLSERVDPNGNLKAQLQKVFGD